MFEICTRVHFSAAHHLRGYEGACANPHGHNWEVEVALRGEALDATGFVIDFRVLKAELRRVLERLDHTDLNQLPDFVAQNPTSERLAEHIFRELGRSLDGPRHRVHRVTVWETPGNSASCWQKE